MRIVRSCSWRIAVVVGLFWAIFGAGCAGVVRKIPQTVQEVPRLTPQQVKQRLDAGQKLIIVDTRSLEQYQQRHIAGAISLPLPEIPTRQGELPRDRALVLYCT